MSEPEKFLDRWSRRKREAADERSAGRTTKAGKDIAKLRHRRRTETRRRPRPHSIPPACRRSNRSPRLPTSARFSDPEFRRISRVRRFVALGRPIRQFATLSAWSRTPGTSTIPTACPASGRCRRARNRQPAGASDRRAAAGGTCAATSRRTQGDAKQNPRTAPLSPSRRNNRSMISRRRHQDLAAPKKIPCSATKTMLQRKMIRQAGKLPTARRRGHGGALPK